MFAMSSDVSTVTCLRPLGACNNLSKALLIRLVPYCILLYFLLLQCFCVSATGLVLTSDDSTLYFADYYNNRIRGATFVNTIQLSSLAGNGINALIDGIGSAASLQRPISLTLDQKRNSLYVTTTESCVIRSVNIQNGLTSTLFQAGITAGMVPCISSYRGISIDQSYENIYFINPYTIMSYNLESSNFSIFAVLSCVVSCHV